MRWAGRRNGDLLAAAAAHFDVFVTVDRNLAFQQNTAQLKLAIVVLSARSNSLQSLAPLMVKLREALTTVSEGQVLRIGS
jgi:hypothetical protein